MKNKELYERTVSILVQAYFNDTLRHDDCTACAVGNIVLASGVPKCNGEDVSENDYYNNGAWKMVFYTSGRDQYAYPETLKEYPIIKKIISITGYTWKQLAKIEFAFE